MVLIRTRVLGLLVIIALGSVAFQAWQMAKFVAAGPRFTAEDGAVLCQRVRELERFSYGYRDAGKAPLPCDYEQRDR